MAEFGFYGTEKDSAELVGAVASTGRFFFIPNLKYRRPEVERLEHQPEIVAAMRETRLFFLELKNRSASFSFSQISEDWYSVSQPVSGPLLNMALPGVESRSSLLLIRHGTLFLPREIFNPTTGRLAPPPDEFKRAYVEMRDCIKRNLMKQVWKDTVWFGREAFALFRQGVVKVLVGGKWIEFVDGKVRKVTADL